MDDAISRLTSALNGLAGMQYGVFSSSRKFGGAIVEDGLAWVLDITLSIHSIALTQIHVHVVLTSTGVGKYTITAKICAQRHHVVG